MKFPNAQNYFIKDFLFFYFLLKQYCMNIGIEFKYDNIMPDLKQSFLDKFKSVTTENFNRAFNLVKNVENNSELNGQFEKENIVNVQIVNHLATNMKRMSLCFVELNEEFINENIKESFINDDEILLTLKEIFSNALNEVYLMKCYAKLDIVITNLNSNDVSIQLQEQFNIQKFYFFFYIIYKMNEFFISFINSNVSFLISNDLQTSTETKLESYMNQFYNCFLNRITKEVKILLMNKEDFSYW